MPERFDDEPRFSENGGDTLTGIRNGYTLATTPEAGSETEKLMIRNFLTTLAEVAIAVASRNLREKQEGGE